MKSAQAEFILVKTDSLCFLCKIVQPTWWVSIVEFRSKNQQSTRSKNLTISWCTCSAGFCDGVPSTWWFRPLRCCSAHSEFRSKSLCKLPSAPSNGCLHVKLQWTPKPIYYKTISEQYIHKIRERKVKILTKNWRDHRRTGRWKQTET